MMQVECCLQFKTCSHVRVYFSRLHLLGVVVCWLEEGGWLLCRVSLSLGEQIFSGLSNIQLHKELLRSIEGFSGKCKSKSRGQCCGTAS